MLPLNNDTMRKLNAFLCLLLCAGAAVAQKHEPVNTKKDQIQVDGYTIRLVPAKGGTYGYEVTQGSRRVIYQTQNPFSASTRGLGKKEDAFAVAGYQVKQLHAKRHISKDQNMAAAKNKKLPAGLTTKAGIPGNDETLYNQHFSPKLAAQLKISITQ